MIPGSANPLLLASAAAAAGGYQVERSLRFNSSDSGFCSRTPAVAGNRKTWTWAAWVKRSTLGAYQYIWGNANSSAENGFLLRFNDTNVIQIADWTGAAVWQKITTQVFRDASAWCHILVSYDTTNATASDRVRLYVNGTRVTDFSTSTDPTLNYDGYTNNTSSISLGRWGQYNGYYLDGYLADIHFIDGQALDATAFTEVSATTGQLIPKTYSGSYGLVADSTGALPIFNTTGAQGAVKDTGTRTDSNSASIVLALPMDGTNGGTSFGDQSAVIRGSGSAKTATVNGNANTSTAQSKFYGSSGYFDGTGDYLSFSTSSDFAFGTGDFTAECWFNVTSNASYRVLIDTRASGSSGTGWILGVDGSGMMYIYSNGFILQTSSGAVTTGKWYHAAFVRNGSTQTLYLDGITVATTTTSRTYSDNLLGIASAPYSPSEYFYGYMQEVRLYKGVAKYTSNFIVPTPNSFKLNFSDNSSNTAATLGKDTSGNSNNWTPNNLSVTAGAGNDSLVDTPTSYGTPDTGVGGEVRGNYATWNPVAAYLASNTTTSTVSNGNLDIAFLSGSNLGNQHYSTIAVSSGKWYLEWTDRSGSPNTNAQAFILGVQNLEYPRNFLYETGGYGITTGSVQQLWLNGSNTNNWWSGTPAQNDIYGIVLDCDNSTISFYRNNSSLGSSQSIPAGKTYAFAITVYQGQGTPTGSANWGQRAFAYTAPSGFKALCDTNIPEGTITTSGTFTGNASADGPFVYLNGVPTAMTINSNAVTFATHADKLSNGFKLRTSSGSYNTAGSNSYSITTTGAKFKYARAQPNP